MCMFSLSQVLLYLHNLLNFKQHKLCKHTKLCCFLPAELNTSMYLNQILYVSGQNWRVVMEITAECLNSRFIAPFFCWLAFALEIDFFSLSFPFPPSLPSSRRLLEEVEQAAAACFRLQRCSKCRVSQTETHGSVQLWTHLQEASERGTRMKLLHSPTRRCLSVCKSNCLSASVASTWRSVSSHFYYLLSHTPCLPPLWIPLFVPAVLTDCLFISGPAAASAPEDEIVMVIVIFCRGDKEGEIHGEEIGYGTYGG